METWPAEAEPPPPPEGELFLDAVLAPNRSLPSPGFVALMATLIGVSFVAGIVFFVIGAWPVPFFFGIDVVLVWLAFRISYRDGRRRELIRIDRRHVLVHRRHPNGQVRHYVMPTAWVRAQVADRGEHHVQFSLGVRGRSLVLGSFLSPPEREDLADAVARALTRAKAPQEAGGAPVQAGARSPS
ncbi:MULTISPECIES: DUF2244 domain-containing protein [Hyphobacterium]|uniref:DUF2244 domain-containing protein n=1 Tax=Hyphobacterium vulgare TaxID=1736751 RepID=A0ABV6ZXJ7_9PROT